MGSQFREQTVSVDENSSENLSLEKDLEKNPRRFSFEMAAYILEYGSDISFGKNIEVKQAPFKTISINSFYLRGTEIEKIKTIDGYKTIFIERLAISGLNAPLPTPYGELILRRIREQDIAMASFINVFNSRLLGISYQISKRRYLNLQNHKNENCMFVRTLAAFCGENFRNMSRRFSRIAYLLWMKEKSASGLESLISSLFGFETKVKEFQNSWIEISEENYLKKNLLKLGINSGLGTKALVSDEGVEINITHSDFQRLCKLLIPQNEDKYSEFEQLKYVVRKYIGSFCSCRIVVTPQNVPHIKLRSMSNKKVDEKKGEKAGIIENMIDIEKERIVLGRNSWFPVTKANSAGKIDSARFDLI